MKGFRDYLNEGKKVAVPHFEPANTATPVDKNRRKKHDRNVKEGTENLKELSTELLGRYKTAARASASAADNAGDFKKGNKRLAGVNLATKKQFANDAKDPNDSVIALRRKVDSAREASRNAQMKKMNEDANEENLEEGWFFGNRYQRIGNKHATHRITFKHGPTQSKHTVDVTAPTDAHAERHVHRHVLGGKMGTAPIKILRIQHLHEGKEVMDEEDNNLQELSIKTLNAYQSKASKEVRQIKSNSNYGAERGAKKLLANRKKGIERANKSRIAQSEDLDEALEIRYAVNHGDPQARHHARKYKASVAAMNSLGSASGASQAMADEFAHHYETAQFHHKEYKKRLKQLEAGTKNEDLQEISKGLAARYLEKALPARDKARSDLEGKVTDGPNRTDFHNIVPAAKKKGKILLKRSVGIRRAQDRLKEEEGLQELSKTTLQSYMARAKGDRNKADLKRSVASHEWDKESDKGRGVSSKMQKYLKTMTSQASRIEKRTKGIAAARARLTKEDLMIDEGLVSKIVNAIKNANKRLTPAAERIAKTREKVGYDNAKTPDLRPRGKALRKVEKIEWSKANPVTRPKPIVPMGKLPDKLWSKDSDAPKPKRNTDDSLDRPMFRKAGAMSRRFKTEELEPNGSRKLLKELPKRDPKTGRLAKSKTAQKVEDCIKMSGKKEKIDTEPTYNPLTTSSNGDGSPNA